MLAVFSVSPLLQGATIITSLFWRSNLRRAGSKPHLPYNTCTTSSLYHRILIFGTEVRSVYSFGRRVAAIKNDCHLLIINEHALCWSNSTAR